MNHTVTIIGAGSWGTAIAALLAGKGHKVTLCARRPELAAELARTRENKAFLPGVTLPASIEIAHVARLEGAEWCFCAVPTRYIRAQFSALGKWPAELPVVSLSKGIEQGTLKFPTEILREVTGAAHYLTLSGPSHAEEVARGLPTVLVSAGVETRAAALAELMSTPAFRVYHSTDLRGVELAGAAKNVVAIAAGIIDGLGLGDNAKAALLARGLAEITRLGVAMGAEVRTFSGLSGVGDLYATCASRHGRNRAFGERIGRGEKPQAIIDSMEMEVEGFNTAAALQALAARYDVEMPICDEVCRVLYEGASPIDALKRLMTRNLKAE
ncbi:MAG: NAD(P)-dependent glycerol-3-phosphate dehydrogenase [Planctomycetes bacterium]|nr:NAD(P)-dependent glycerol-3-phosphate dehydrogenase [Planctomycetota bacterium]MCW8134817.1 NAD(P)-dependent glycerol-3-phosphate dehydrogenase [Planctomycetota bacterium]